MTIPHTRRLILLLLLLLAATVMTGCSKGMADGPGNNCPNGVCPYTDVLPPPNGVAQFTFMPTAPVPGLSLTPLGSLNPPGHVLPTDHVYLYSWDLSVRGAQAQPGTRNVYMPATGALFIMQHTSVSPDWKLMFRATDNFYFYMDHVVLTTTMNIGDVVQAGTLIGTTDAGSTLDLGAFDATVTHDGFLTPARYPYQTLHAVSPWKYFAPALQPQIYAQMYRAPGTTNKDGKIDFGIDGALAGDWFLQGMPADSSYDAYGWPRTISFAYDFYDPTLVRISIGGTVGPAGVWATDSTVPRPENVNVATGLVAYQLYSPFDVLPPQGVLLVQMVGEAAIKVELFMGTNLANTTQFDANAYTFVR
jgi:hypothetical protein